MKLSVYVIFIISVVGFSQQEASDHLFFKMHIKNGAELAIAKNQEGLFTVSNPNDLKETEIYSSYNIYNFERVLKSTTTDLQAEAYMIETDDIALIAELTQNYPNKYTRIAHYYPNEKPFYPNDYGATSPLPNLGVDRELHDLDVLEMPKAWGITTGSKKVVLGISDSRIDSTDAEFSGRVSKFLKYFSPEAYGCIHGSNVAAIAGARLDNGYGRPGICGDCDMIATGYGSFKFIEELVESGARVVNASWVACTMGPKHKEIEERINQWYEDGIIIVAAAGNGKNCHKDEYHPDDYGYPASYEKVISVTGSFVTNVLEETEPVADKNGRFIYNHIRDRHSSELTYHEGKLIAPYHKWGLQANYSVDFTAPAYTYLHGNLLCDDEIVMGGVTSGAAPFVTGVLGLIFSENYCLTAYEAETILKLSSEEIENLSANTKFKGRLGAGRINGYRAVKMARQTKELFGTLEVSDRDMYRYHYRLKNAPYNISVQNQTFRDSASVSFTARNAIYLKPGTRLAPDKTSTMVFKINPDIPTEECFPKPPKVYERLYRQ